MNNIQLVDNQGNPVKDEFTVEKMQAWAYLRKLNEVCHFQTREGSKYGAASNSELKRWLQNKAVSINNEKPNWNDEITFPITQLSIFTKDKKISIF